MTIETTLPPPAQLETQADALAWLAYATRACALGQMDPKHSDAIVRAVQTWRVVQRAAARHSKPREGA